MKDVKTILIALLAISLIGTWAFYIHDKSQYLHQSKETASKDSLLFKNAVLNAIKDSLEAITIAKKSMEDSSAIAKDSLTQETNEPVDSTSSEKDNTAEKNKRKHIAIPLNFIVTGVNFSAISEKAGEKPEVTSVAKETSEFILSFLLQSNFLRSSSYNVYVVVTQPDSKILRTSESGNDYFISKKEGRQHFSSRIHFTYIRKSKKTITCILKPAKFLSGTYIVKIYHDGVVIGQSYKQLQ